ncbi:MAG: transporter permease subunit [Hydrocarboniphaga sp.]|uniref:ABC transporter permease n=1 Tax=Hydrocarboniphaga sp. TaxID=2033016 RepID=UPI0026294976|nr:ABC transporter permease subunit [Hydrocarboniphaga sp.]MDB5973175.1 transporter permease subunit [Hydrocarboniphaga sp.]
MNRVLDALRRNRWAMFSAGLLLAMTLLCIAGPWLSAWDFDTIDFDGSWSAPPSAQHWFGTDSLGRDLYVRTLCGGRISLAVGLVGTLVSLLIGVAYGAVAGYIGGRADTLMMRAVDILYALPFLFLVILLMVLFGRHLLLVFVAIGAINWLDMARIVRGETLALKQRDFVAAAIVAGAGPRAIITQHIVPNLLGVVVVYATLTVPQVILMEAFLSFLGLGVQAPATSWGALVSEGARDMEVAPAALIFPATFLAVTLLALNLLGDALRDALDPRRRA